MKVILTEDVYKHGVAGEEVSVADGFARNYLIPRGMAVKATPGTLKRYQRLRSEADKRRELRDQELQELAESIEALSLPFGVKAGEGGKLYGSVTTAQIAEAVEEAIGFGIDRRRVGDQPLRELGVHKVAVRLSSSLTPGVQVLIHREDEPPESVLDVEPTGEVEEEATIFDTVMGDYDYEEYETLDEGAELEAFEETGEADAEVEAEANDLETDLPEDAS